MKILVLGARGMLGHMACRMLAESHEVIGALRSAFDARDPLARFLPRERWVGGVDALRLDTIAELLERHRPDAVLNCIGIVKQLREAKDPLLSIECNALFPHRLAALCGLGGAKLIHLSTDCVFSGRRGNYTEDDNPDPVDLYGRTKLLGEVGAHGALTLRTSIVGRQLTGQTSLFEWLTAQRGGRVKGFARAIYTGLTTRALSRVIQAVLERHDDLSGVWQVASQPITKFDLISELNRRLGLGITIDRDEAFACDRSLDGRRFVERTGIAIPSWEAMLEDFAADNVNYDFLARPAGAVAD